SRPPFRGEDALETLRQVCSREPERPGRLVPGLDPDLETVCLKCLEKEPGRRYDSAAALADDLERWRRGEPVSARPVGRAGRLWRWCRRNPVVAGLTGAVAATLVAGTVIASYFAILANERADRALREKERADANAQRAIREGERANAKAQEAEQNAQKA